MMLVAVVQMIVPSNTDGLGFQKFDFGFLEVVAYTIINRFMFNSALTLKPPRFQRPDPSLNQHHQARYILHQIKIRNVQMNFSWGQIRKWILFFVIYWNEILIYIYIRVVHYLLGWLVFRVSRTFLLYLLGAIKEFLSMKHMMRWMLEQVGIRDFFFVLTSLFQR